MRKRRTSPAREGEGTGLSVHTLALLLSLDLFPEPSMLISRDLFHGLVLDVFGEGLLQLSLEPMGGTLVQV